MKRWKTLMDRLRKKVRPHVSPETVSATCDVIVTIAVIRSYWH